MNKNKEINISNTSEEHEHPQVRTDDGWIYPQSQPTGDAERFSGPQDLHSCTKQHCVGERYHNYENQQDSGAPEPCPDYAAMVEPVRLQAQELLSQAGVEERCNTARDSAAIMKRSALMMQRLADVLHGVAARRRSSREPCQFKDYRGLPCKDFAGHFGVHRT